MQALHVGLVSTRPNAGWLEKHRFLVGVYTIRQLVIEDRHAVASDEPSVCVEFDWVRLSMFERL